MVALSFLDYIQFDLHSYLFGDILTVRAYDLWWIYIGGAVVLALLILNWSSLTLMTIHEDLAKAEGCADLPYSTLANVSDDYCGGILSAYCWHIINNITFDYSRRYCSTTR